MRLLLAEDDQDMAEVLEAYLTQHDFIVEVVNDGAAALEFAQEGTFDAYIFDVMMPRMDGLTLVQRLREAGDTTPIMLLTAKGTKDDRVAGFNVGADDYLPKPFAPDELLARVRALLRRPKAFTPTLLTFDDLSLDPTTSTLMCGDAATQLSRKELQILQLMMRNPTQMFDADRIIAQAWEWDNPQEANVVWVHVSNLRKQLKAVGSKVTIKATRGLGYRLLPGAATAQDPDTPKKNLD
jgi:DNA-binding response OmpR family regulator